jgi:F-type H+-transporting ATPase subunit a
MKVLFSNSLRIGAMLLGSSALCLAKESTAVSQGAYKLSNIGGLPITNAMVTGWAISLLLIVMVRCLVGGRPRLVPTKGQLFVETAVESMKNLLTPIVGMKVIDHAFPILIGFFSFILIHNWSGLLPGVGTFGFWDNTGHFLYFFRPANSDLNTTLGLSIVAMVAWGYIVLRYEGFRSFVSHLFGNKADRKEVPFLIYSFLFFIFLMVGLIECVSILFRLVSLSFRLYGNVFGGESLLSTIQGIYKFVLPVPFYFLEVLIGAIQAFVFTLLLAVYIGLVCNHEEAH